MISRRSSSGNAFSKIQAFFYDTPCRQIIQRSGGKKQSPGEKALYSPGRMKLPVDFSGLQGGEGLFFPGKRACQIL
jgi:hypothetical protein